MLKIRTILIALTIFISQAGCKFGEGRKSKAIKEFEGIITYHEIQTSVDSILNWEDTVQVFYSHGDYVGIHSGNPTKYHIVKDYYLKSKPLRLFLSNNSDTLYQLNLNPARERLNSFKLSKANDQIFSRDCEKIDLKISFLDRDSITFTDASFVFSRSLLPIDKEHF